MTEFRDTFDRPAWWHERLANGGLLDRPIRQSVERVTAAAPVRSPRPETWRKTPEWSDSRGKAQTYVIAAEGLYLVKIGIAKDPTARLKTLQSGQPMELHLLWSVPGSYESQLHAQFAAYRTRGEWFDLTPLGDPVQVVTQAINEIRGAGRAS